MLFTIWTLGQICLLEFIWVEGGVKFVKPFGGGGGTYSQGLLEHQYQLSQLYMRHVNDTELKDYSLLEYSAL
jgi:hypothetical protein